MDGRRLTLRQEYSLGIDVGSVSTNFVLVDGSGEVRYKLYLRTEGRPIEALIKGMSDVADFLQPGDKIVAAGTTGSGRRLAAAMVNADIIKNEITAHAAAACAVEPGVKTIIEIGGQDSKIIILDNGIPCDFAMNTVCAAGTGSFLDRQAARLNIPIEEFGSYALRSKSPVRIAGRCAVFAESDMIHKQQMGHPLEDIIAGLCEALVRNYLNNLAKGKKILAPVLFQGGVAANVGIVAAFKKYLGTDLIIPKYYDVMGAYGVALLARENVKANGGKTGFLGVDCVNRDFRARSIECSGCSNMCEVICILSDGKQVAHWGDKCGKYA
ncbi:MAG: 2-hydroxyglutaryl-CoA dehydratase [Clostridiales bacterium]|nr:2-hydroxyglutaryl-CoA dehydratase [Clostridiales bacterium]